MKIYQNKYLCFNLNILFFITVSDLYVYSQYFQRLFTNIEHVFNIQIHLFYWINYFNRGNMFDNILLILNLNLRIRLKFNVVFCLIQNVYYRSINKKSLITSRTKFCVGSLETSTIERNAKTRTNVYTYIQIKNISYCSETTIFKNYLLRVLLVLKLKRYIVKLKKNT